MSLAFPRDVLAEMYFPGRGWTDVLAYVRQTTALAITWGQAGEQGNVAPSLLSCALENSTGDMSPTNPLGAFHGLFGRGTPFRWAVRLVRYRFTGTVVNGWGPAEGGEVFTNTGNGTPVASEFQVTSGVGTHSVPATVTYRRSSLAGQSYRDCEVRVTLTSLGFTDVTGGAVEPANVFLRGTDSPATDYYLARMTIEPDQSVKIGILQVSSGVFLAAPVTVPGLTYTGQPLTVVLQAEGQQLRAKVYDATAANSEPFEWNVTTAANTDGGLSAGYVGVRSGVATGNTNTKPVVYSYDNFEVRSLRASMEFASLKPRWDESHRIKWVEAEASGIFRRLTRGNQPLKTAIRRYVERTAADYDLLAYWALDDDKNAETARLTAGQGDDAVFTNQLIGFSSVSAARVCGRGDLGPWLRPAALCQATAAFLMGVGSAGGSVTSWTTHAVLAFDGLYTSSAVAIDSITVQVQTAVYNLGNPDVWFVNFTSDTGELVLGTSDLTTSTVSAGALFDGNPHLVTLRVAQDGADCDMSVYVDGTLMGSVTQTTLTNTRPNLVVFASIGGESRRRSLGHFPVYEGDGPPLNDLLDAMLGHAGETAGRRLERLCSQEGIAFMAYGDLDETAAMGPQGPETIMTLLGECADADQGLLFESRGHLGVAFRTRRSLYNQDTMLALDYSAQQVKPPLAPAADDKATVNVVTAKRKDGGEYTDTQTTGPLNVNNPWDDPDGVGVYDDQITVLVQHDEQLGDVAGWRRNLGTTPEERYAGLTVDLKAEAVAGDDELGVAVLSVGVGDRLVIESLTAADIYDPIDQLVLGTTETFLDQTQHAVTFNTVPASPYRVFVLEDAVLGRLSTDDSDLDAGIDDDDLTASVAGDLWTTTALFPDDFPLNVVINGEVIEVSGISGTSSPQTFTLAQRGVNGLARAHAAGSRVRPYPRTVLG